MIMKRPTLLAAFHHPTSPPFLNSVEHGIALLSLTARIKPSAFEFVYYNEKIFRMLRTKSRDQVLRKSSELGVIFVLTVLADKNHRLGKEEGGGNLALPIHRREVTENQF